MRVPEIELLVKEGKLKVDGEIVVSNAGELTVTKGTTSRITRT